jgi:hypothetical protein
VKVEDLGERRFAVTFESAEELAAEERNLAVGGLFLRPAPALPAFAVVTVTLRLAGGPAVVVQGKVVATPPGGVALQLEGDPGTLAARLRAAVAVVGSVGGGAGAGVAAAKPRPDAGQLGARSPESGPPERRHQAADQAALGPGAGEPEAGEAGQADEGTLWEWLRNLTPPQKQLLAPKADRVTRALLLQDSDPMVTLALLKNPRLSIDEVIRVAKSGSLGFQAAELILKTSQWAANLDVRLALIHNPKTPLPIALRILPTLPDSDVRFIARGNATSMALKQAALRKIHPPS